MTVIQVNTLKTTAEELIGRLESEHVSVCHHAWMPDCLVLSGTGALERLLSFQEGLFYVQDPAAKLSVLCARLPEKNVRVLDCCAAPGGKSFAAAIATKGNAVITSCDVYEHKTALIAGGASRLGISGIQACLQNAAEDVPQWHNAMDVVIADVPCSGYGIIRKKPDIRFKKPEEMATLPDLQLRILKQQARYVKPGGVLMYSTCTLVRAENEGVVEAFLEENREFVTEPLPLPECFPKNATGMLALVPGQYDTDGFFICRMRRRTCTRT